MNHYAARKRNLIEIFMRWLRVFLFVIAFAVIVYVFYRLGPQKIFNIARTLSPDWVGLALIFWFANLFLVTVRFRSLAAPDMKFWHVMEVVMVGFLLNYASMVQGVGIGAKIGLMKGRKVSAMRSLAASGGEVILDLIFTIAVTCIFAWYIGWANLGISKVDSTVFIIATFAIVVVAFGVAISAQFTGIGMRLIEGLKVAFAPARMPLNFFCTAGIWAMGAAAFYCMIEAAGGTANPILTLSALSVGFIAGLISFVPGGLGVRDVTWAYIASIGGSPVAVTIAAAFAYRVLAIVSVALALAIWALVRPSKE